MFIALNLLNLLPLSISLLQVERQIHMQNVMREQQIAMQIARSRDLFHWWATFYALAVTGTVAGYVISMLNSCSFSFVVS